MNAVEIAPWNWPMSWRIIILLNVSFYNMMGNIFAAGVSPLFGLLIKDFHCSLNDASYLASYALLMLGVSNVIALPIVEYAGKRYTILVSMAIFLGANIWGACAQSYDSLLGSRFVGGFAGGIVEALGPFIVSECFPEHQLARAMVVYVGMLAAGSAVGPIIAGGIASGTGNWRWFFGVSSILIGLNLISCILMLPETTHVIESVSSDENFEEKDASAFVEEASIQASPRAITKSDLKVLWTARSFYIRPIYVKDRENPISIFLQPWPLLLAPPVLITTIIFGLNIGWTALTSIVVSNAYNAPPHSFAAWQVGFLSWGNLIGLLMGLPIGGMLADFLSARARKHENGEHDPRARLPAVIPGALISPAGCLLVGFALKKDLHWIAVSIGWGMISFGLTASANVLLTYSVDSFRTRAGHVGVLVNVVKNTLGFGIAYISVDWYESTGPAKQFGTMAGLLWAFYLLLIPIYFFSRSLVRVSEKWLLWGKGEVSAG